MNDKIWILTKKCGKELVVVASRNKLSTILAIVVIFLIVKPKHVPQFAQNKNLPQNIKGAQKGHGVATNEILDPILTLEAGQQGADPKWSLPANLSTSEVQEFVAQIRQAFEMYSKLIAERNHYIDQHGQILNGSGLLFSRLDKGGFKDQKLAADWYAFVKDQNGLDGWIEIGGQMTLETEVEVPMAMKMYPMQTRAIGGHALTGDILFLKAFQAYLNYHLPYYENMNAAGDDLIERLKKEFPDFEK